MITKPTVNLETFHELAIAHTDALAAAIEAMEEAQHQYLMLRSAMKRLLKCPALNMDELENEDLDAIGVACVVMDAGKQFGLVPDDSEDKGA